MILKLLIVVCGLVTLIGCEQKKSHLVVGVCADYPPFEYKMNEHFMGFDIDLANHIGQELGQSVEFRDMAFNGLLPSLNQGDLDLVISCIGSTSERIKHFDFSIPYYKDNVSLVFLKTAPVNIENIKEKKLGLQLGAAAMEAFADKQWNGAKKVFMDLSLQLVEALKAHHLDVILMDLSQAKTFCKNNIELDFLSVGSVEDGFVVAMKKGSPLLVKVNVALEKLKNSKIIRKLEEKWIGE